VASRIFAYSRNRTRRWEGHFFFSSSCRMYRQMNYLNIITGLFLCQTTSDVVKPRLTRSNKKGHLNWPLGIVTAYAVFVNLWRTANVEEAVISFHDMADQVATASAHFYFPYIMAVKRTFRYFTRPKNSLTAEANSAITLFVYCP